MINMKKTLYVMLFGLVLIATFAQAEEVTTSIPEKKTWMQGAIACVEYRRNNRVIMQKLTFPETGFTTTVYNITDPEDQYSSNVLQILVNKYQTGGKMEITKHTCPAPSSPLLIDFVDKNGDGKDDVVCLVRDVPAKDGKRGRTRLIEAFDISVPGEVTPLGEKAFETERKRVEF